jgi:hypothetical protein
MGAEARSLSLKYPGCHGLMTLTLPLTRHVTLDQCWQICQPNPGDWVELNASDELETMSPTEWQSERRNTSMLPSKMLRRLSSMDSTWDRNASIVTMGVNTGDWTVNVGHLLERLLNKGYRQRKTRNSSLSRYG